MKSIILSSLLSITAVASERQIIAATILGEARGEGFRGMYAVACVIKERSVLSGRTVAAECLRPKQFDANRDGAQLHLLDSSKEANYALFLADNLDRLDRDWIGRATHFVNLSVAKPKWAEGRTPTRVVKNHSFFRLDY